jgi:hypothetical protein
MKGNMKKLSVLVGVLGIALFTMVVMTSADAAVRGHYAVTGYSTCNPASAGIFEADYTFNDDGITGSASGFVRSISGSGPGFVTYTVDFTYVVTNEGRITFEYPWGGNHIVKKNAQGNTLWDVTWNLGPGHGVISPDGKTITITCGPPVVLMVIESNNPDELPGVPPVGYTASCVTTAVGIRLK